jgi:hypothetical protein
MAFKVAAAVSAGGAVPPEALAALPIPPAQKRALVQAVGAIRDTANGSGDQNAIIAADKVLNGLPPDIQKAIISGIAVSRAQNMQKITASETKSIGAKVAHPGLATVQQNPILLAGYDIMTNAEAKAGYVLGAGLMTFKLNETALESAERSLKGPKLAGFDFAVALYTGLTSFSPPSNLSNSEKAGWFAAKGMRGADNDTKGRVAVLLASHKGALAGAKKARNPWERFLEALGF